MDINKIEEKISSIIPLDRIEQKANMALHSGMKCGGMAAFFITVNTVEELQELLLLIKENNIQFFVIGNGSNVIFADDVYDGIVIKLAGDFSDIVFEDNMLSVGAAVSMPYISKLASEYALKGFEFACGIPGSIGGGIFMNAGAYGGNISDCIKSVVAMNLDGEIYEYENEELDFSYRHSRFENSNEIILFAKLVFEKGDKDEIKSLMMDYSQRRKEKQPLNYASCGSFFKRPLGNFASKLIDECGLKGVNVGDAEVSALHAGFIVNKGNASVEDVLDLCKLVIDTVKDKTGICLEPEVRIVGKWNY